ncbi:MAG TPA: molecular chaperone DnaJ, partial [Actinomycetota bacterium]|nr:molecular chaperone DnaJ [Actinomycetota bacterium]
RDASQEEIRRAYRRLAREYHPDVSQSHDAEDRFKEIAAAYEILSDPQKRQQYDRYGQAGGPMDFPFGDVADIFEAFFGGGGFGRRTATARRSRVQRGEDAFASISLSFEEAAFGAHRDVEVERLQGCDRCAGSGAEPGTSPTRCRTCGGTGQVQDVRRSIFGTVMTAHPCAACDGTGEEVLTRCERCRGSGRVAATQTVPVDVPAGVADGLELRVTGAGHAGTAGGPAGDLYLTLSVDEHAVFERRGQDLFATLEVPMVQAALGAELEIETLDGSEKITLEPGTESGTTFRLRGKGMPHLGRRGRGDLYVTVHVATPALSREERKLVEQLAELQGRPAGKRAHDRGLLRRPGREVG